MSVDWRVRLSVAGLRLLPRNMLSRLAGWVASRPIPRVLRAGVVSAFGRHFGVDFDEVRDPLDSFESIQAFFTRELAEGVRPVDPAADAFVSPCDGSWGATGRVEAGQLLQVKGRPYSLTALLGDEELAKRLEGGSYATLYLSPRDYHRFHAPCRARVVEARYLPGTLWPVNRIGVEGVSGVFAENERVSTAMTLDERDEKLLCIVAVGALNVGKVKVRFDDLETNTGGGAVHRRYGALGPWLEKGEEWGRFEFGSTLVVVAAPGLVELDVRPPGSPLRLGRRIGTLASG